jgi:hypothetical protein
MVAFDGRSRNQLDDRHFSSRRDQFSRAAFVIGTQMHNHHKRHTAVSWHMVEEVLNSLKTACGSSDTYYRKA